MNTSNQKLWEFFIKLGMLCHDDSVLQNERLDFVERQFEEIRAEILGLQTEMQRILQLLSEKNSD